ncbi:MAG: cation transporting ATPase C-terminal domain-containing protein, partial [Candidatus Bathyarchaeia archaeon]
YESLFQTAWFIESLTSQTLVIFAIRTKKSPFWKSKPSRLLLLSSIAIITFALIIPYTPLGEIFRFVKPPATFYIALAAILGAYIALVEVVKSWFYKRYGYRLEQILIPPKKMGIYLTKTAKLIQNVIAVICLRSEDEITVDSLLEDLERSMEYPLDYHQVGHTIQHLKRASLISFEWRQKTIKREKPLKEYVTKQLITSDLWPKIAQDWHKISKNIKEKHGKVNPEYQELLHL